MRTSQREGRVIMIKSGGPPTPGGVAVSTSGAFTPGMPVIFLVTGVTTHWRTLKNTFKVALGTLGGGVQTCQPESRGIMVKERGAPGRRRVTAAAIGAQAALMGILLLMTGNTIGWGLCKHIRDGMTV